MSDNYTWEEQQNLATIEHWKERAEKAEAEVEELKTRVEELTLRNARLQWMANKCNCYSTDDEENFVLNYIVDENGDYHHIDGDDDE